MTDLSAEDIVEITAVVGRSQFALDEGCADAWVDCFADGGVFRVLQAGASRQWRGRQELDRFAFEAAASMKNRGVVRRWLNSIVVEGFEGKASVTAQLLVTTLGARPAVVATGARQDLLVLEHGAWKLAEHHVLMDEYSSPATIAPVTRRSRGTG